MAPPTLPEPSALSEAAHGSPIRVRVLVEVGGVELYEFGEADLTPDEYPSQLAGLLRAAANRVENGDDARGSQ